MFTKNMPRSRKKKRAILIRPGVYSTLMFDKREGKESWKKKKMNLLCLKQVFFRNVFYKSTKKSSRVIVRDHSGQSPVQYLENLGPAMKQSDWLICVIDPLN